MRSVQTLIDKASAKCGGDAALGRKIGASRATVGQMRHGQRPISPVTVGLLCDVLELSGEEARRLAVLAVISAAEEKKRGVLRRAFFVLWPIGAVFGMAVMTPTDAQAWKDVTTRNTSDELQGFPYIHCRAFQWLAAALKATQIRPIKLWTGLYSLRSPFGWPSAYSARLIGRIQRP